MDEENKQTDNELEIARKQAEEYLNNWKRERADFINYKKDEIKRMEEMLKFSTEGVIIELIDAIDAIEVARKQIPDLKELESWKIGFDSSFDKLMKFLEKFGVEKIEVNEVSFDPLLHEAVTIETRNGEEKDEKELAERIEEIRPGYTMHGKVIRPARVKIIK